MRTSTTAATCRGWPGRASRGPVYCDRRDARPVRPAAARLGPPAGGGRAYRQPARLLASTSRRCRCTPRSDARRMLRRSSRGPSTRRSSRFPACGAASARPATSSAPPACTCTWDGGSVLFSGDLGRNDDLLMRAARAAAGRRLRGRRVHLRRPAARRTTDAATLLAEVINRTAARGGVVVIPAFAVGRAQALMSCWSRTLKRAAPHPRPAGLPEQPDGRRRDAASTIATAPSTGSTPRSAQAMCHVARASSTRWRNRERLNDLRVPAVIISASGMATGGRVVHHLKAYAPDHRNTILFAGYQAAGTRGAALVGGAKRGQDPRRVRAGARRGREPRLPRPRTPTATNCWPGSARLPRRAAGACSSRTASRWRPTACARRSRSSTAGRARCPSTCRRWRCDCSPCAAGRAGCAPSRPPGRDRHLPGPHRVHAPGLSGVPLRGVRGAGAGGTGQPPDAPWWRRCTT